MTNFFEENRTLLLGFIILSFALVGLFYMLTVKPLKSDVLLKENNIIQLEMDIKQLESRLNNSELTIQENTSQLEKKLPLSYNIDQLLLDLQEVELVSGSQIQSISFSDYNGVVNQEQTEISNNENEGADNTEISESENTTVINETPIEGLPENVKAITYNLTVESPDFNHFLQFLKEIEKLERINRVDVLSFSKPGERELLFEEKSTQTILTNIQLTTFYYQQSE